MNRRLILVGGVLNILLGVFHALFPFLFDWGTTLRCLTAENRQLVYALSFHATLVILGFGVISVWLAGSLWTERAGRALSWLVVLFYLLRVVEQFFLFSDPLPVAAVLTVLCLGIAALYAVPLMRRG